LEKFGLEILTWRPRMKEFLGHKRMTSDEEVEETVTDCLNGLAGDFHDERSVKLDKCLNRK
jgi:hypothetical protein